MKPLDPHDMLLGARRERVASVVASRTRSLTVVLEDLEDPHNIAAVLRSCESLGIQEVNLVTGVHPFHPNPKITQGCEKWLDLRLWRDAARCLDTLSERGFLVCAAELGAPTASLLDLPTDRPVALVFGTEKKGLSPEALSRCSVRYKIPMLGFSQSLNVSVAAAISLAHLVFRRIEARGHAGDLAPADATSLRERFERLSVNQRHRLFSRETLNPAAARTSDRLKELP